MGSPVRMPMATIAPTPIRPYPDDHLTVGHLQDCACYYATRYPGQTMIECGIAFSILRHFLGNAWFDNTLQPRNPTVDRDHRKSRAFLGPDGVTDMERRRLTGRVL